VNARVAQLVERLDEPLLLTNPTNVFYLVGFESTNAALVVDRERVRLFTDFRYRDAAARIEGVELVETERNVLRGLASELAGARIGFEAEHVTYARWQTLADGGVDLVPTSGLVEALRAVKDEDEIDRIARAAEIATRALERLLEQTWTGRTERELANELERLMREEGADDVAFPSIVAAGENGALPHAHPGARRIEPGMLVTIDWGAKVDGYCSDCTRTFAVGEIDEELRRIYDVCMTTQSESLSAVEAGRSGFDVDVVAREHIAAAGYGEAFGHGLGHGVGLEVHEGPTLRPESEDTLAVGNIVTVEPGIYLPGTGGVRIEDLVVVTEGEPRVLTRFPKSLTVVG
jgi:Xaa-Pro aminopeptidase